MRRYGMIGWALAAMATLGVAHADIVTESVTYRIGDEAFEGYYARNTAISAPQPVVVIVHDWDGLNDYERTRARMLAREGYAAFAIDLYGKGARPETVEQMRARSGELRGDRALMRERLNAGVAQLGELEGVEPGRAVAIGYCFGGSAVLELARSGAPLQGFVTFHGGLGTPEGQGYDDVQAPLLVLHGSADNAAPMAQVVELAGALDQAGVDYRMEIYGGAPHAFTEWSGDRYRPGADLASWRALMDFLGERL